MNRMPVSRLSWRPLGLEAVLSPSRPSYRLSQAMTNNLLVEVVDQSGRPIKGASVQFGTQQAQTDSKGMAGFSAMGSGGFEVRATYNGLTVGKTVSADEIAKGYTVFLQFPVCIVDPLLRPMDFVIFGVAGGMIAAGSYWKIKPLEMTGEIALGAAVFGFIYRLQCM
jgi:hypothetical protein